MHIHDSAKDTKGAGRWEASTGRYIPLTGGSRTRLPVTDDPDIPRYHGFVGINERLTPDIGTMAALIKHLGGGFYIPDGPAGKFVEMILTQARKWFEPQGEVAEE